MESETQLKVVTEPESEELQGEEEFLMELPPEISDRLDPSFEYFTTQTKVVRRAYKIWYEFGKGLKRPEDSGRRVSALNQTLEETSPFIRETLERVNEDRQSLLGMIRDIALQKAREEVAKAKQPIQTTQSSKSVGGARYERRVKAAERRNIDPKSIH
ncbi:hypothetical protein HY405_00305 [Candidatus Microgenomates bacterium]|nr:hypothetical protein [Candidatus Microgenomates bacterium]